MFVRDADEAVCLDDDRPAGASSPYLDLAAIERAFSRRCRRGMGWLGLRRRAAGVRRTVRTVRGRVRRPAAEVMRRLGDKIEAKLLAERAEVPVAPWSGGPVHSMEEAREHAEAIGYPLMIKATAGGGGRGIRQRRRRLRSRRSVRERPFRGRKGVRRSDGVHGASREGRAPRRGADHRRCPWDGVAVWRPRLHHAASQPEGVRGVALHCAHPAAGPRPARRCGAAWPRSPATSTPGPSNSCTSRASSALRSSR